MEVPCALPVITEQPTGVDGPSMIDKAQGPAGSSDEQALSLVKSLIHLQHRLSTGLAKPATRSAALLVANTRPLAGTLCIKTQNWK